MDRMTYRPEEFRFDNNNKYNTIMGRDMPERCERFENFERMPTWDRRNFEMMPWNMERNEMMNRMPFWENRWENRMMPSWDRRFEMNPWNMDRFTEMNRMPWNMNRWENRMMPNWDRRFEMMPFEREMNMMNNWMENLWNVNFRPSHPIEYYTMTHPIRVLDREGNRDFYLCFDLKGFKPEEITCTLNKTERCIVIEAKHEVKEGKEHHVMRHFFRKFMLPTTLAKIDLAKCEIKSCLSNEGMFTINMDLPKLTNEEIKRCPEMTRQLTYPYYPTNNFGCSATCNTNPINTKMI